MYEKILITTDGSPLSRTAALAGIELARRVQAEVLGLYVAPAYQYPIYIELVPPSFPTEQEYEHSMRQAGDTYFSTIEETALKAGLAFSRLTAFSDATAKQIVDTARLHHCDLIFMGSHGRGGWGQLLLGSVTNKVLSSCTIPVLVHRMAHNPHP